jgi:hypothetical protein
MFSLIKNIAFSLLFLTVISCDDPAPTEIINVEEEVEISIINPEPNSYVITGYDSTGITSETPSRESVITLSGIKNTLNNTTVYKGYGEAIFFDTTDAVYNNSNRLIGFKTFDFSRVRFNNVESIKTPYYLRYRDNYLIKNILLGTKHSISFKKTISAQSSDFIYNQQINVEVINNEGTTSLMTMRIPDEINGKIELEGSIKENNLKVILVWNKSQLNTNSTSQIVTDEIIVGGLENFENELVPLFRLTKLNTNRFTIPNSLVEDILTSKEYEYIVFSFIRKISKSNSTSRLGDVYFASQSIHNIYIRI